LWGKLKRAIPGFGDVSIRGDVNANERDAVALDVRANGFGTALQIVGRADNESKAVSVSKVQVTKDIDTLGGTLTVNPKYDLDRASGDVRLVYSIDNTSFQVDAEKKKLTVAHSFPNKDEISPSVSASGEFSISYTRDLERGKLTTTWAPNDALKMQWTDGEWETTIKAPLEGYYKTSQGFKVNMKRSVGLL
jgi:hypothetical protein